MTRDIGANLAGYYRDRLFDPGGVVRLDTGWRRNTILDGGRVLLASLMKGDSDAGIGHMAVGQGESAWDSDGAPAPTPEIEALVNPYAPFQTVAPGDMTYLTADAERLETEHPTPVLQVRLELPPGYPAPLEGLNTYPLREFGLVGGTAETPYLLNCIRHPVIHKDTASTLVRTIRLFF